VFFVFVILIIGDVASITVFLFEKLFLVYQKWSNILQRFKAVSNKFC